ncbi:MAG: DUF2914 domain-containing protein [Gammaproteobacteria bacterium]|nr:DUF2914 domain-containing protein [Gammaproteobacteria bacterium]
MSDKKSIVIKVKYPSPGKAPDNSISGPSVITEWNLKRIGLALGSLLLVMMMWFYFSDDEQKATETAQTGSSQPAQPEHPSATTPSQSVTATTSAATSQNKSKTPVAPSKAVVRVQLTSDIKKNEPVNKLKLPLKIGKNDTRWIYYFAELQGMTGQAIYHEWWLNGNLVSRKKVNVSGDPWRTASKQVITYTTNSDWIARVVDENRNTLTETSFNVE